MDVFGTTYDDSRWIEAVSFSFPDIRDNSFYFGPKKKNEYWQLVCISYSTMKQITFVLNNLS